MSVSAGLEQREARGIGWDQLLASLQCPKCRGTFCFESMEPQVPQGREFGILSCACGEHPVLDGVPVLLQGRIGVFEHTVGQSEYEGPNPSELLQLLRAGRGLDALLLCIAFPYASRILDRLGLRRLWNNRFALRWSAAIRRNSLRNWCLVAREQLTAEEWFDLFFRAHSPVPAEMFNYFFYRLAQPRHLATLLATGVLRDGKKPVLDLACGFGHLGHNFSERESPTAVVGLDRNFFQLWAAQYWVAPRNRFVCADADQPLPFKSDSFSGVLCSDAFHYFRNKAEVLGEIDRCAPGGPVVLARVGNGEVSPNEGFELSFDGYLSLFGRPSWTALSEESLLRSYLQGAPVSLAKPGSDAQTAKWLYFIQPGDSNLREITPQSNRPHAAGHLGFNPIYHARRTGGGWLLEFRFPSEHYACENGQMSAYHPASITVPDKVYESVMANERTPEVQVLIDQLVVLGMPRNYVRR